MRIRRLDPVILLVILNVAVFVVLSLLAGMILLVTTGQRFNEVYLLLLELFGALQFVLVLSGEVWRVLAAMFLHVDPIHLLANMWSLFFIGQIVVQFFDRKVLLIAYVLSGIVASVASLILLPLSWSVGASGAVFGLLGLLIGGALRRRRFGFELPFTVMDVAPMALLAFLYGFTPNSNVNNVAHFAGFACGILLGYIVPHSLIKASAGWYRLERLLYWFCLSLVVIALVCMVVFGTLGLAALLMP